MTISLRRLYQACLLLKQFPLQLTVLALLAGLYQTIRTGGELPGGWRISITTTSDSALQAIRENEIVSSKAALLLVAKSDAVINDTLSRIVAEVPGVARARVSIVHDGMFNLAWQHMMKASITHAVAAPGYSTGNFVQDIPLSQWSAYLGGLLEDKCVMMNVKDMKQPTVTQRLSELHILVFSACPLWSSRGNFLGALFLSWDSYDSVPDASEVTPRQREAAAQISSALSLQHRRDDGP